MCFDLLLSSFMNAFEKVHAFRVEKELFHKIYIIKKATEKCKWSESVTVMDSHMQVLPLHIIEEDKQCMGNKCVPAVHHFSYGNACLTFTVKWWQSVIIWDGFFRVRGFLLDQISNQPTHACREISSFIFFMFLCSVLQCYTHFSEKCCSWTQTFTCFASPPHLMASFRSLTKRNQSVLHLK